MDKRTKDLYQSLVGSSTDYSFKSKLTSAVNLEKNIQAARKSIKRDIQEALSIGGNLCVMLLAELTNYYRNETYYMAVRGAIEMRRYRPSVLEYLHEPVQERAERLVAALSSESKGKVRDLKVSIAKYFLKAYPSRLRDFKKFFTREELMIVA